MSKEKIKAYIDKQAHWTVELKRLRKLLNASNLTEEVKWGMPTYTMDGKNLIGLAGFKNHFCLWFHQGGFLKDPNKLLQNAQEGKTKGMRHMKFVSGEEINDKIIKAYINETIENHKAGKVIKNAKTKVSYDLHPMLADAFNKNKDLKKSFDALSPSKQKDYSNYISDAKREATKMKRLETIVPLILEGKGINDKYKR